MLAFLNVLIWTFVIPPFQVPDEISHFGYAQYLAETGRPPPQGPVGQYSPQEQNTLDALSFVAVVGHPAQRGIMNSVEEAGCAKSWPRGASPVGEGGSSSATDQPPLYYALEAIPYLLSPSQDILARLELMRVLSALMAALTVLCIYMFLRELMPGSPWAWTVGALVGRLSADVLLHRRGRPGRQSAVSGLRRDVLVAGARLPSRADARRAALIGRATVVGVLAKLTFIALLPGIALALAVARLACLAERPAAGACARVAVAAAIVVVPALALRDLEHERLAPRGRDRGRRRRSDDQRQRHRADRSTSARLWTTSGSCTCRGCRSCTREFSYYPLLTTWLDGTVGHSAGSTTPFLSGSTAWRTGCSPRLGVLGLVASRAHAQRRSGRGWACWCASR